MRPFYCSVGTPLKDGCVLNQCQAMACTVEATCGTEACRITNHVVSHIDCLCSATQSSPLLLPASADMADLRVVNMAGELIMETRLREEDDYGGPDLAGYRSLLPLYGVSVSLKSWLEAVCQFGMRCQLL